MKIKSWQDSLSVARMKNFKKLYQNGCRSYSLHGTPINFRLQLSF